jgi:streptogramin lyase
MKTRKSTSFAPVRSAVVAAVLSGAACTATGPSNVAPELVGTASAALSDLAPTDALCLQIQVVGSSTVTRTFDVTPLTSTNFLLEALPLGVDTFTATAYGSTCNDGGPPASPPTWLSNAVPATVVSSPPVSVTLQMHSTADASSDSGGALVTLSFPSVSSACPPVITEFTTPTASSEPSGIVAGPDGNLWFTEGSGDKLGVMGPRGGPIAEIGPLAGGLAALTVGPDGNIWFAEGANDSIAVISPTGTSGSVQEFPVAGKPTAITTGPDGNIWFAFGPYSELGNGTNDVGSISPTGGAQSVRYYSTGGTDIDALAAGPDGRVWFTDFGRGTIGAITPGSTSIDSISTLTIGSQPSAITTGPDGNIWFTEFGASKIGVQVPSGTQSLMKDFAIPTASSGPSAIVAGPDGNIWFTEENTGKIGVMSPTGGAASILEFDIPTPNSAPNGIVVGPDGNLWFSEGGTSNIGSITPYGVCVDSGAGGSLGGPPPSVCTPICSAGTACVNGACVTCGGATQPCCTTGVACGTNLTCSSGTCSCGGPGEACCGGTTCSTGISCEVDAGAVCSCGGAKQACCPTTSGGNACGSGFHCSGVDCSCLVACSGYLVQKSDQTLWSYAGVSTPTEIMAEGVPLVPINFATATTTLACAVVAGGAVFCWDLESGSNGSGQLGNGGTTTSTTPGAVLTSPGPPSVQLAEITAVYMDEGGQTVCALDGSGSVWCWGAGTQGQLGNGGTADSTYATPVLAAAEPLGADAGTQFTGMKKVAVAADHVCALDNLGRVWCWGSNSEGQCGYVPPDGGMPPATVPYPTLVSNLASIGSVTDLAVSNYETCTLTAAGNVYCWGYRAYNIIGGSTSGTLNDPQADAGVAITNAIQIVMTSSEVACVLKSDRSIWCWGNGPGPIPEQLTINGTFLAQYIDFIGASASGNAPCFVDDLGQFYTSPSSPVTTPVSCP